MKKRTTTHQINEAITNNLLQIIKVENYNKSNHQMSTMDNDTFKESLEFLSESGILANCIGWKFEKNHEAIREYIIETGRMNSDSDLIVTVYMSVVDGVSEEQVEEILVVLEEG